MAEQTAQATQAPSQVGMSPFQGIPNTGGLNTSLGLKSADLPWVAGLGLGVGQLLSGVINTWLNKDLAQGYYNNQEAIAKAYYGTQTTIANNQKEVALAQIASQNTLGQNYKEMHTTQVLHEEKMKELEVNTQERIARVLEDGKTSRAKIFAVSNTFSSRRSWEMGTTVSA